jgi:hypothetical protein
MSVAIIKSSDEAFHPSMHPAPPAVPFITLTLYLLLPFYYPINGIDASQGVSGDILLGF